MAAGEGNGNKRFEDFREAMRRELDSIWVELGNRREDRWKTITLFVIVACAFLGSVVSILLALIGN